MNTMNELNIYAREKIDRLYDCYVVNRDDSWRICQSCGDRHKNQDCESLCERCVDNGVDECRVCGDFVEIVKGFCSACLKP